MLLTGILIPSYAYTYIKMSSIKQLIMDVNSLKKLNDLKTIKEFIEYISPYYPDISIKENTIVEIEQALFDVYIKLIGKILYYSPENMRIFLRALLLKFEITNIKQIILGSITGLNKKEKSKRVNFLVEELLEKKVFIENLLEITSLDEIQLYMKNTKYNKAIREGLLYFKDNHQIFVLESFLDRLFYENLDLSGKLYKRKENDLIPEFIKYKTEIYNLRIISRGIQNKVDKKLLKQFFVDNYLFFNREKINELLPLIDLKEFISKLESYYKKIPQLKKFGINTQLIRKHLRWSLEGLYQDYYFKKNKIKIDDFEYLTIYKILEIIINKEKEIKFNIMPNVIRILHEKYEELGVKDENF